jgi:hypothetical protein
MDVPCMRRPRLHGREGGVESRIVSRPAITEAACRGLCYRPRTGTPPSVRTSATLRHFIVASRREPGLSHCLDAKGEGHVRAWQGRPVGRLFR